MMEKEHHKCPVCHTVFETGDFISADEEDTVTGWSQCPGCTETIEQGFVVLVESTIDEEDPEPSTGNYYFLPEEFFKHYFKVPIPDEAKGMLFVEETEFPRLCDVHRSNLH